MPGYTYTIRCCRSRGEADLDRDPLHDVAGLDTMGSALERHTEGEGLPAVRERARELAAASGQREHQARLRGGATPPAGLARWPLASRRGKPDPTTSEGVRRVLRGLSRAWVGGTVDFGSLDRIGKSLSEIIEPVSAPAQTADSSPRKYHQTAPLQRIGRVFWQTLTSG